MTWKVTADPLDFDEAIAWFRKRVAVTKADFEQLSAEAKRKAFTVANVAQLDLVHHAWSAIDKALKDGVALEDFKKSIGDELRRAWAGSVDDPAWRLETVFRTNLQLAYNAGRHRQASHPDVAGDRPVWMFDAILDGRETDICRKCDETKLPSDHVWWKTHTPPLHFNCRSSFIALTDEQAGPITANPTVDAAEGDFGLAPGADEWTPNLAAYPQQLSLPFQAKQHAAPPPPPALKLVEGVHVKKVLIKGKVSDATRDALLESISDAETLKWLETTPLEKLRFAEDARVKRTRVNGWYHPLYAELEVCAARKPDTFGQTFDPGVSWSISKTQTTAERAAKATLRHELGHHVHLFEGRGTEVDLIVQKAYAKARAGSTTMTRYGAQDHDEYFAECYAAYYFRRPDLQKHDPNGFKMVEDVLTKRGILP